MRCSSKAIFLASFLAVLLAPMAEAQEPAGYVLVNTVYLTTGSGTYTTPAGIDMLEVECVGGGGGGGAANSAASGDWVAGGGGGGGGYAKMRKTAPATSYAYTVGAGGAGASAGSSSAGATGSHTEFDSFACGRGGSGGLSRTAAATPQATSGGTGGLLIGSPSGWALLLAVSGDRGGVGMATNNYAVGGSGGASHLAPMAPDDTTVGPGAAGGTYGGGGGGGTSSIIFSPQAGGAGAGGIIVIHEYVLTEPRTLVVRAAESPGANCEIGGEKVSWGQDDDRDGVLDVGEVEDSVYVCEGRNGYDSLMKTTPLAPGAPGVCVDGGVWVESGLDDGDPSGTARNGVLEAGEVDYDEAVCNGEAGATGPMGPPGSSIGNLTVRLLHPLIKLSADELTVYAYAEDAGVPIDTATLNLTISTVEADAWTHQLQADMVSLGAGLYSYTWQPPALADYNVWIQANSTTETAWTTDVLKLTEFEGETMEITTAFDSWVPLLTVFGLFMFAFFYGLKKHPAWALLLIVSFLGVLTQALGDTLPPELQMPWEFVFIGAAVVFLYMFVLGGMGFARTQRQVQDTT